MPATAKDEPKPDPTPAPKTNSEPSPSAGGDQSGEATVPPGRLPAGVYEFTGPIATQYLEVPLTAYPASQERPATVFDWPLSAPADGRWESTKKKPNTLPDNAPADPEE